MKKLLGIVVLGLLLSGNAYAERLKCGSIFSKTIVELNNNSGKTKVILSYKNRDVLVPVSSKEDIYVKINDKLLSEIRSIAGNENVEIKYQ